MSRANKEQVNKSRILITDDEKSIRNMFKLIASSQLKDLRVDIAVNGHEAVECFRSVHHGVIIMDIHMPVKDGLQAFREIEAICTEANWGMPVVIFCTGYQPPKALDGIIGEGSRHLLLLKPVEVETIVSTVNTALKQIEAGV